MMIMDRKQFPYFRNVYLPPPASPCVDKKGPNIVETAIMVIIGHSRLPASHTVCAPLSSPCRDRKANISGFLSSGFDFHN